MSFPLIRVNGFLNLHKPFGFTSHDCVARVRKLLHTKRVGHGGTLDPAATGVLPIAVGQATRLLQFLPEGKAYRATVRLGLTTTTDDLEGEVLTTTPAAGLTLEQVQPHLAKFEGTIQQVPPRYSAIHVGGKRLYDLARSGEVVEVPVRTVEIHCIEVLGWRSGDFAELELAITCGAGTYIRSIARDLGEALGTGGTLAGLVRTQSSGFGLENSLTLEDIATQLAAHSFQLVSPQVALRHLGAVSLSPLQAKRWSQGQKLPGSEVALPAEEIDLLYRVQDEDDRFLGIGRVTALMDQPYLVPKLVFNPE